jgi:3-methyladenine DNA glycosylase Tag
MSYCKHIEKLPEPRKSLHKNYHDNHYGFPLHDDNELFGRLIMEINQAGLSWETILKMTFKKSLIMVKRTDSGYCQIPESSGTS